MILPCEVSAQTADQNNAAGVMHIGAFPNGTEFATFVLARYNYPFELTTPDDQKLIAAGPAPAG